MDAAAENPLIRRQLLEILQDAVNRRRDPGEEISTYVVEALLQRLLALRGFALALERMRGQLFWLRDRGYVKFHETKAGSQRIVSWRITDHGVDVLEGSREDTGVAGV